MYLADIRVGITPGHTRVDPHTQATRPSRASAFVNAMIPPFDAENWSVPPGRARRWATRYCKIAPPLRHQVGVVGCLRGISMCRGSWCHYLVPLLIGEERPAPPPSRRPRRRYDQGIRLTGSRASPWPTRSATLSRLEYVPPASPRRGPGRRRPIRFPTFRPFAVWSGSLRRPASRPPPAIAVWPRRFRSKLLSLVRALGSMAAVSRSGW